MNRKNTFKVVIAFVVVLALVLPGSSIFANIGTTVNKNNTADNANNVDWWPMYKHDPQHTSNSTSEAPDTNNMLWSRDVSADCSSPAVVDGKVFIGSYDNNIYCLDATDGSIIWNYTTGNRIESSPAVANGMVFIASIDNNLYCLNAQDGSLIWSFTGGYSSPAIDDGRIFFGSNCLALNGSLIWSRDISSGKGSPAVADGRVFIGSQEKKLYCLDASDGSEIWSYSTDGRISCSSPTVADGMVYIGAEYPDNSLHCLNASDGSLIWNYTLGNYVGSFYGLSPSVADGMVFIGNADTHDCRVFCLNAMNGSEIWNYSVSGVVSPSPAIADGKAYVGSNWGFFCLDEFDGSLIWCYDTSQIHSSAAIADGRVYIGSIHNLYCFGGEPKDHDVGVTNIKLFSGPADIKTPEVAVQNFGLNNETDVPVSMVISKDLTNEYNEIVYIDIDIGENKIVTFPDWTPDGLNDGVYGFIDYDVLSCTHLVTDENLNNDCKAKTITLDYGIDWWPMFRHDPEHTGYSTSTAPDTNDVCWSYDAGGQVDSSPAIVDGRVFVGDGNDDFLCLDASDGLLIWKYTTESSVYSSPAVADDKVFFGSCDHNVYCLDAMDGSFVWNYTTGDYVKSSPAVVDGKVYASSYDRDLYCLNATDGSLIWNYTASAAMGSSPAVADGKVYVGACYGGFYCLDATNGSLIWNYTAGSNVDSSPAIIDGRVYFGSADHNVYCLDALDGSFIWNYTTGAEVRSSPAVADGKVFIGSKDNNVYCLDALDGSFIWNYNTSNMILKSSPAVADGKVFIGSADSDSQNNSIYCLNATDGSLIWEYITGVVVKSSPAIADGKMYIGSGRYGCKVYCFGTSPPDTTPPVTTHEFDGIIGDNNWHVTDVTITLTATDDISGVDITYYRIDSGAWEEYHNPVVVSDDGEHTLEYYSVDNAENIEDVKGPFAFKIDQTPPVTTCALDGIMEGGVYITDVTVTLTATDDMSGVAGTLYKLNDGEWQEYSDPVVVSEDGDHIISFYSIDNAGNTEDPKSESFTIQHPCPIEINISGGLGVNAVVTNTGEEDITDLEWSITVTGGLFGRINKEVNGTISILAADDSVTVKSGIFLGLGSIGIMIIAGCAEETMDGKQIIIFTIIN